MSELDGEGTWDPGEKSGEPITDFDRRIWASIGKMGQFTHKDFKAYMLEYLALNQPLIPVGQLVGYQRLIGVRGLVSSAGAVVGGTGFTAAKNATGVYEITFTDPFEATPVLNANSTTSSARIPAIDTLDANHAILNFYSDAGALADASFSFWAMPVEVT